MSAEADAGAGAAACGAATAVGAAAAAGTTRAAGSADARCEGFSSTTGWTPLAASQCARSDGSRGQGGSGASSTSSSDSTVRDGSPLPVPKCALEATCATVALLLLKPYLNAQRDQNINTKRQRSRRIAGDYSGSTFSILHALLMSSGSSLLRRQRRRKRSASCSSWNRRNSTSGTSA